MLSRSLRLVRSRLPFVAALLGIGAAWAMSSESRAGTLYTAIYGDKIEKYDLATGADLGPFWSGSTQPEGLALAPNGDLYVAMADNDSILKFASNGSLIGTYATGLNGPRGIAFDSAGNLFVASWNDGSVRKIAPGGGTGAVIASGMGSVWNLALDSVGNVYVTSVNDSLYKVDTDGHVSVVRHPFSPSGLEIDTSGNIFLADDYTTIVKIAPGGSVGTYATAGGFFRPNDLQMADGNGALLISSDGVGIYHTNSAGQVALWANTPGTALFMVSDIPEPSAIGLCMAAVGMWAGLRRSRR